MDTDTMVKGFKASAAACGLKKDDTPDIALIFSEKEAVCAGVFTNSKVKAAPVLLSMKNIAYGKARAIIVNAGNANACTGEQGMKNADRTIQVISEILGISKDEVLVASTGVIGAQLDIKKIEKAAPELAENLVSSGLKDAAEAIMTTDSFSKICTFTGNVNNVSYNIAGIAKGAGMIMPDMATMLCFILTDINIGLPELKKALLSSVEKSFNRITVDGDTSTNDTVFVLANGEAGNDIPDDDSFAGFQEGLEKVMTELAVMIVKDGEGATKVIYVNVNGAASSGDALTAARTVANSSLVKTAFYGQDPNWGRIMGALGRAGIEMREDKVDIFINDIKIVEGGIGLGSENEMKAAGEMKKSEFSLTIELNMGDFSDRMTTCDLTHEYVSINADYRT
ncbi:bifunctional glutamate N-acetyltransferase/amino-acid acetyltransferase ArgJ [Thermodesulfobacteriota bacterium]